MHSFLLFLVNQFGSKSRYHVVGILYLAEKILGKGDWGWFWPAEKVCKSQKSKSIWEIVRILKKNWDYPRLFYSPVWKIFEFCDKLGLSNNISKNITAVMLWSSCVGGKGNLLIWSFQGPYNIFAKACSWERERLFRTEIEDQEMLASSSIMKRISDYRSTDQLNIISSQPQTFGTVIQGSFF